MAAAPGSLLAAVMLLISSGLHRSSSLPLCPDSCSCQTAPLFNCSSSGLSSVPPHIPDSVTELDLSNNLLDSVALDRRHPDLRRVWLGNNSIAHLSLCVQRDTGGRYVRGGRLKRGLRPWRGRGCVSWAPTLQLLSVERNQLEKLPQGLEGSESLQVLQLSFNRISTVRPGELNHLQQLKELHLQHNLITSLHPQMFQDLVQLQVLDLSFNMLTSLHPLTYLSLRNIGADVMLVGNRWRCDCSIRSLRRRMAYDSSSRGLQAWSLVCASPSVLSGRDLLQLEEEELNCFSPENGPELHRDVTVYRGSEIMLSCAAQDSTWWTPGGPAPVSQPEAGLVISDITETDTGLYVCVSEEQKVVSIFNLQISKIGSATRKTRSLPRIPQGTPNWIGQERNQRTTQSNLALAVCLSVFITFLVAFILGVIARPWVDGLWRRVTKKKRPSATNSVSSVEQRQYENEGFCDGEEPEQIGVHRERRVTFSTIDYREESNVKYYDTVAGGNQGINSDAAIVREAAEAERVANTAGDSGSENSLSQSSLEDNQRDLSDAGRTHNIEFEHIPDPEELVKRRSSSSCSDSSRSDKVFSEDQMIRGDHSTPKLTEDSVQQRADSSIEVPRISTEELPGFSSEPFADWSPYPNNTNPTDPWQENEEPFEFSDSVRSASARSSGVLGSFSDSKLTVAPTFAKQKTGDMSSSSSYVSEGEPTLYIVNADPEDEDIERNHDKLEVLNGARFEQQIHGVDAVRPSVGFNQGDTQRPAVRHGNSFSSHSSDGDDEDYRVKEGLVPSKSRDNRSSSPPAAYSYSSSSESEAEITNLKVEHNAGRENEGIKINDPEMQSTDLDHQCIPQIERHGDISTPVPASDSSSSDESEDEMTKHTKRQEQVEVDTAGLQSKEYQSVSHDAMNPQWPGLDLDHATPIKKHLDIKAPSPHTGSSSSSDSEDETTNHMNKQEQGEMSMARLPNEVSQTSSQEWPTVDLEQTMHIKRRLDIKAPSPPPDSSSSSDSEDETTGYMKKQEQEETFVARHPVEISQNVTRDPQQLWPVLDLEDAMRVKKRLDVKAPSPASDSSSDSDSEHETTGHTERPGKVDIGRLPFQECPTGSHDPDPRWPALDLEDTMRVKRRLDVKAPSPPNDSSSSCDSEDETTIHIKKQEQGETFVARHPVEISQNGSRDPQQRWPVLDLEDTMRVKRHLDVKAPSPASDSSSSSDSGDETTIHTEQPGKVDIGGLPFQESQTGSHDAGTRWPVLDLEDTMRVKRRLDIKAPSPPPDSSSSSDSEDETTIHIKKQEQGETFVAKHPVEISQNISHDPKQQWPALDLEDTMQVKRRLDVKAPSPASDSSSSSDSEHETTGHTERPGKVDIGGLPFQESQTGSHDAGTRWPVLDLEDTRVKRRLDVKAPLPASDSSSSSDSEDETTIHIKKQEQGETFVARHPVEISQNGSRDPQQQWPVLDLEDTMRVKRRLDIKAPSPPNDSSSSSDSEDETTIHIKKQEQGETFVARHPVEISQKGSCDPQQQWPVLDLEDTMRVKRRLDVKAPSPASDSSSSSDSEHETTGHTERPGKVDIGGLPFQESQTGSHDPDTRWPALDLEDTMRVKRRLDIKAPSPPNDSSSSSDSEDETTIHIKKQEQGETFVARHPVEISQNGSRDPQQRWPVLDLEDTMRVKRHLDVKAPSPASDSSSSSDSGDETTIHTERPGKVDIGGLPFQESQTGSHDAGTRWPVLDLEDTRIKRRVDIKAPSPASDSSSSSDSETTLHTERPGKVDIGRRTFQESQTGSHDPDTRWPALDLEDTMRVKRRLDIKAPSPPNDSSSSSDSEDETTIHLKKQQQGETFVARHPVEISQNGSRDPQQQWPVLDLEGAIRVKRHLDVKAPSPASDSSSSSDSEDDTTHHIKKQEQGEIFVARLPSEVSQTPSHERPTLDLEQTMRIKRRLDIKAPSPPPDSSSSSDNEHETTGYMTKQEQGQMNMDKVCPNISHDPQPLWPVLDLEETMRVKRRLDIKAPSPPPDSSSSSESEDETTGHTEQPGKVDIGGLPLQESQTGSHDPDRSRWPVLDLEHIPHIKRHLDIKAPSPVSDSSSSSDSEDDTTHHIKKQGEMPVARIPSEVSQTPSQERPTLDLEQTMRIKRRLDIKAPSPPPDSSSSSDSEDETTGYMKKQEQGQMNIGHDPQPLWPVLDLEEKISVKRRLDIKAPSPPPDSSSSSDSEDDTTHHINKQKQGEMSVARLPSEVSQTPSQEWPTLDLEQTMRIKRRLDIKAPSPPPDSSSSSDSEDETQQLTKIERPGVVGTTGLPYQVSQTLSHDPDKRWPSIDLEHIPRIERRLDIKAPSPASDSSSSSDSEDDTTHHIKKQEQGEISVARLPNEVSKTPSHEWPTLDLEQTMGIKRRLDIKAPSPPPDSSDGIMNQTVKGESSPCHSSSSSDEQEEGVEGDPDSQWPRLDLSSALHVKRRLDIKACSPPPESSSSSVHESGATNLPVKVETKLPKLSPGVPYMNRRLDFKAPSLQPDPVLSTVSPGARQSESNSSGSDGDNEYKDHAKIGLGVSAVSKATEKKFIRSPKIPMINISRSPKTDIKLEKYTVIGEVGDKTSDNSSTTPEITPELQSQWATMYLGKSRFRKRSDITSPTLEPPNLPSTPPPDSPSSSSSESETGSQSSTTRRKRREVGVQGVNSSNSAEVTGSLRKDHSLPASEEKSYPDTKFTGNPYFRKYLDFIVRGKAPATPPPPLDQPQSQTEVQRKAGVELKNQATKVGDEPDSHLSLTNIPHIKRALDIRAPVQRESSSSSNSEGETIDQSVPNLSLGVPLVKRRLDVKAPLPEPGNSASSCSEIETQVTGYNQSGHATNVSGMTYHDSLIAYKRVIMKDSSLPSNSFSPSGKDQTTEDTKPGLGDRNASPAPKTAPRMTFEDIIKKRLKKARSTTDLPPEIRWTGVGRQLSDVPIPKPRKHLDGGLSSTPAEPELPPPNSSSSESDNIKQDKGKTEVPLMHKSSSLGDISVSLASSRDFDESDNPPSSTNENLGAVSEARNEKKGLRALRAMSFQRRQWDEADANLDKGASLQFGPKGESGKAIKFSPRHSSSSSDEQEESVDADPDSRWPGLDLSSALHVKRHLDIKAHSPPPESSSSSIYESGATNLPVKVETNLPKMSLGVPYINRRRTDFKAPSLQPDPVFDTKVEKDTKAPAKQPPTHQRGATDLLHGISRYRRHDIGGTEPPQGPPPPIPSTPPPPYEAVGWRSAQSRTKQGLEGTRNSEESDHSPRTSHKLTVYFDPSNSNISEV